MKIPVQVTTTNGLATYRKPAPLRVGEAESSATQLLLQDAVLFSEILDDCVLMTADPASQGGNEDLPGLEHCCHPEIVAKPSANRQLFADSETG